MCSAGALPETCPCPVHREKTLREESPVRLDVPGHHRQTVPDASAVDHRSLRCPVQVTFKDVIRSGDPPHGGTTPTPRGGTRGPPRRPDPCTVDQPGSGVREGVGTRNGCGRRSGVTTIGAPGHRRPRSPRTPTTTKQPPPGDGRRSPRTAPLRTGRSTRWNRFLPRRGHGRRFPARRTVPPARDPRTGESGSDPARPSSGRHRHRNVTRAPGGCPGSGVPLPCGVVPAPVLGRLRERKVRRLRWDRGRVGSSAGHSPPRVLNFSCGPAVPHHLIPRAPACDRPHLAAGVSSGTVPRRSPLPERFSGRPYVGLRLRHGVLRAP